MTLLPSCGERLRSLAVAAVALALASCATVRTQSPLDYIGPAQGGMIQPAVGSAPAEAQPAATTTPAAEAMPALPAAPAPAAPPPMEAAQPASPASQPAETPKAPASQPLSVSITEAVLVCLENNQGLVVQRYAPQLSRTAVEAERASFDPDLSGQLVANQGKGRSPTTQPHRTNAGLSRGLSAQIAVDEFLPTGTSISVEGDTGVSYPGTDAFDEFYASRIGVNVTQPLLRGFGLKVNLAALQQAQIDVKISQYELRGYAQDLVASVQETYWDYALAAQQIAIVTQSLELAKQQLNDVAERVAVGSVAETELAAPQAQVALREGNLIDARSVLARTRLNLIRLLNPDGTAMWDRDIILQTMVSVPEVDLGTPDEHAQVAMRMRPDLNQARLQLQRDELTVVRTRNGLLPQLDLFINVGRTGYAESFAGSTHGRDGLGYDVQFGGRFEFPPINRAARAAYTASVLNRSQQIEAISNLEQLAQVDVRTAYIEVGRTREQISATAATRRAQQETLRAETEKFRVGKSTSLLVAVAQTSLLQAQIAEVQAVVGYLKALIELYRLDGTLLVRMGIQAPGFEPVMLAAK
jgi:outer membrane protein